MRRILVLSLATAAALIGCTVPGGTAGLPARSGSAPASAAAARSAVPPPPATNLPDKIACGSAKSCLAVGTHYESNDITIVQAPALAWDGGKWRSVSLPRPKSTFAAEALDVSCKAGLCQQIDAMRQQMLDSIDELAASTTPLVDAEVMQRMRTVADHAYRAWSADRAAGLDSVMLAPTRDLVSTLNVRARTDRLAASETKVGRQITLGDGNQASAGDVIISGADPAGGSAPRSVSLRSASDSRAGCAAG